MKLNDSSQSSTARLISIDSLRGIAAIGVVLFHGLNTNTFLIRPNEHSLVFNASALLFSYGYTGVFLFFVISGFCIHLRWAKHTAAGKVPDTNFVSFWKRRIRRLYPAYLVALVIYMFVLAVEGKLPATWFTVYDTVMHLLMLHNLDMRTCYSLNGVFWTLAIEEQLYLAYFLLLFLRNRLGWPRVLTICLFGRLAWFALCAVLHLLFRIETPAFEAAISNWFVWALGAVAVEAAFGLIELPAWCRKMIFAALTLLVAAGLEYTDRVLLQAGRIHDVIWLVNQPIWGLGFFFIVNYAVKCETVWAQVEKVPGLVRALATVGIFSYSLYLTHELILGQLSKIIGDSFGLSLDAKAAISWLVLCPASILFARAYYQFFEKPFLPRTQNQVWSVSQVEVIEGPASVG